MDSKDEIDKIAGFANKFLLSAAAMNKNIIDNQKSKTGC